MNRFDNFKKVVKSERVKSEVIKNPNRF